MTQLTDFPEIIRKNGENQEEKEFLFWLQRLVNGKPQRELMLAGPNGFSKATEKTRDKPLPVYAPLFNDQTCIRLEMS